MRDDISLCSTMTANRGHSKSDTTPCKPNSQQEQQSYSSWRSSCDVTGHREKMKEELSAFLQESKNPIRKKEDLSPKVLAIESYLFQEAGSLAEYLDRPSLRQRLLRITEHFEKVINLERAIKVKPPADQQISVLLQKQMTIRSTTPTLPKQRKHKRRVRFSLGRNATIYHDSPLTCWTDVIALWLQEADYCLFRSRTTEEVRIISQLLKETCPSRCHSSFSQDDQDDSATDDEYSCMHSEGDTCFEENGLFLVFRSCLEAKVIENEESNGEGTEILAHEEMAALEQIYQSYYSVDPSPLSPTAVVSPKVSQTCDILGLERLVCQVILRDRNERRDKQVEVLDDLQSCGWPDAETEALRLYQASIEVSLTSRLFARCLAQAVARTC